MTLEVTKKEGESSGLALYVGPLGYLRVYSVNDDSCFVGLIEKDDEIMMVNGKGIKDPKEMAEAILCATDLKLVGRFNTPPPKKLEESA